jgi:membrane-anchored glycerophosphoryl diester phosphodiesterase (GDPDase)
MWVGMLTVAFLAEGLVAGLAILLVIVALVVGVWLTARLTMAGWLAAEGRSIRESLRGSWRMSQGHVGRIVGWQIAFGLLFGLFAFVLGELLSVVPYVGSGVTEAISLALGYGAGVVLYRRVQADGPAMMPEPSSAG